MPGPTAVPQQVRELLLQALEHERGVVRIPTGPGLGIEVDRAALAAFRAPA